MPDFSGRRERERQTAAAVLRGGDLAEELSTTFLLAVQEMANDKSWDVPESEIRDAATSWASGRAGTVTQSLPEEISPERAEGVAITETTAAITAGEKWLTGFAVAVLMLFKDAVAVFHTEEDEKVCSVCKSLNRVKNPPIHPPVHPHCRCWEDWEMEV